MPDLAARIVENAARVREQIAKAARQSSRQPHEITLVCVTKYVGVELARILLEAGYCDLGESRPQELWQKASELAATSARWHLIGHLQRNKAARTLPLVSLIHSVDSERLLATLDELAARRSHPADILLEVNVSGDAAKHGFHPQVLAAVVEHLNDFPHLRVRGLMTMASLEGGRDQARRDFAALRILRNQVQSMAPPNVELTELSMGMSEDFDLAIAEGATIVRVGSTLFEGIEA